MSASPRTSLFAIRQVRSVFVMSLLGITSFAILLSALPVWAVQVGLSEGLAGTVTTVMLIATVVVQLLSPTLMRRFSLRTLMLWGLLLIGLPSPLYIVAHQWWSLYAISAVRGVGFALLTVVGALAIRLATPRERQGEAVGVYGLAAAIPTMMGVAIGAGLTLGGLFPIVAGIAALPALAALLVGGITTGADSVDEGGSLPFLRVVRRLLIPLGVLLVATAVGGGVITVVPLELTDGPMVTAVLLVMGGAASVARWRIGHFTDRRGHRGVMPTLVLIGVIGLALLALGLAYQQWILIFTGCAGSGVAYGALQSVALDQAFSRLADSQASVASAAWNAAFDTGTAVGAAVLAAVAATSLAGAGALGIAAAFFLVTGVVATAAPLIRAKILSS